MASHFSETNPWYPWLDKIKHKTNEIKSQNPHSLMSHAVMTQKGIILQDFISVWGLIRFYWFKCLNWFCLLVWWSDLLIPELYFQDSFSLTASSSNGLSVTIWNGQTFVHEKPNSLMSYTKPSILIIKNI